jgi:hypothetical protein
MANGWYELERYVGGQWILDSMFDEKDIAVSEAERLIEGRRVLAVRICWSDDSGRPPRTVFRKSVVDGENREAAKQRVVLRQQAAAARNKRRQGSPSRQGSARRGNAPVKQTVRRTIALAALCAAAAAALWYASVIGYQATPLSGSDYQAGGGEGGSVGPTIRWGHGGN